MIYHFDPYTLDTGRLELRRAGDTVEIEPQVFRLLVFLIENRDRVVGKDELIESVWAGRVISDATLNTRINAARRAVGDDGRSQSVIRTFARRGFRFVREVSVVSGAGPPAEGKPASDDKPVIAVLPFESIGDDEGIGAGLVSMMVTELSRRTGVEVIGREAVLRLSGPPVDFTEIRNTVGADYALTGMVHRIGRQVRVYVELCETGHGRQVWSERYDRELGDAFELQDELSHVILMSARWNMAAHDGERAAGKPDAGLSIADRLSKAAQCFYTPTPESYRAAGGVLDGVLEEDSRHPMALSMRAFALYVLSTFDVFPLAEEDSERAGNMADLALEHNERSDFGHWVRGTLALNLERDHASALAHARRALEINPHFAPSARLEAEVLCFDGEPAAGVSRLEALVRSDPRAPGNAIAFWDLSLARFAMDEAQEALEAIDEALVRIRTMPDFYLVRIAVLNRLGRSREAATLVEQLRKRYEGLSLSAIRRPPFREEAVRDGYLAALSAAGLPD